MSEMSVFSLLIEATVFEHGYFAGCFGFWATT